MYMFPLFLLIVFIMARTNSTYHPHLHFKRNIIIKNKTIASLLIGQSDPVNSRTNNAKANRNKLTYAGIFFYGLFLLLCCFSLLMAILPDFPCESFVFDSGYMVLAGNTLNQKLPCLFALILLFAESAFHFINTSKYAIEKASAKKFTCVIYYLFSILFSIGAVGGLWIAITTIIETISKA